MSEFLWRLEISREAQMSAKSSEVWQKRSSPVRVQKRGRREHGLLTLCFNLNHKCDIALIYRMSTNQILIDWLYQSHFYQSCDQSTARALLILSLVSVISGVSRVAQMVKNLPAMWETQVRSLDQQDSLEKGMATHSSSLAWRSPWIEEPGGLQSMGSQRVGHSWLTNTFTC